MENSASEIVVQRQLQRAAGSLPHENSASEIATHTKTGTEASLPPFFIVRSA